MSRCVEGFPRDAPPLVAAGWDSHLGSMTVPIDYERASADFDRFMLDMRTALDLQTTHQAWGVLLGVFDTFRRRLTAEDGLTFARALPPLLRSAFVQDWHPSDETLPFGSRDELEECVMAYHRDHQLARPGCIAATAAALWKHIDASRVTAALARMPEAAADFWRPDASAASRLSG